MKATRECRNGHEVEVGAGRCKVCRRASQAAWVRRNPEKARRRSEAARQRENERSRAKTAANPKPRRPPAPISVRIAARSTLAPNGCLVVAKRGRNQGGHVMLTGRHPDMAGGRTVTTGVHRWAWMLVNGPIPPGMVVRHRCDNPPCANPDHLELGTVADNSRDAVERGRIYRPMGERSPNAKLNDELVRRIRHLVHAKGVSRGEIARRFGIDPAVASRVASGKAWGHVR